MNADQPASDHAIAFMTFNIRLDTPVDRPLGHGWDVRKKSVLETVRRSLPDVVGFQEALLGQLEDLTEAFPDYAPLGGPRETGPAGEYVPLFVERRRFEIEDHGDYWLSTTPGVVGSLGWDAAVPRHCTWARLRDRRSGALFSVHNTHLDRWGELARLESARLISRRAAESAPVPAVLMGDFNATESDEPLARAPTGGGRCPDRASLRRPVGQPQDRLHHV